MKSYVRNGGWVGYRRVKRTKQLDGMEEWVNACFLQHQGNAEVVRQELKRQRGIEVSLRTVERMVAVLRRSLKATVKATVRFETPPGQQHDELGYLPLERGAAHLFFQLVTKRYERGSIMVTSNRTISEWGDVFGDSVVATAILDRLLHRSSVVTIRGESYRLREKRRSGLIGGTLRNGIFEQTPSAPQP